MKDFSIDVLTGIFNNVKEKQAEADREFLEELIILFEEVGTKNIVAKLKSDKYGIPTVLYCGDDVMRPLYFALNHRIDVVLYPCLKPKQVVVSWVSNRTYEKSTTLLEYCPSMIIRANKKIKT